MKWLIENGGLQANFVGALVQNEVSVGGEAQPIRTLNLHLNLARVGARGDDEVMLDARLVAVVDKINSGIDAGVADLLVGGHIGLPFLRVLPDEMVHLAGLEILPGNRGVRIGADQVEPDDGAGGLPAGAGRTGILRRTRCNCRGAKPQHHLA